MSDLSDKRSETKFQGSCCFMRRNVFQFQVSFKSDSAADMNHECVAIPAVCEMFHFRQPPHQSESFSAICRPNRLGFKSDPRVRPCCDWRLVTACLQLYCESSDSISASRSSGALMCRREGPTWPRPLWVKLAGDLEDTERELNSMMEEGGCVHKGVVSHFPFLFSSSDCKVYIITLVLVCCCWINSNVTWPGWQHRGHRDSAPDDQLLTAAWLWLPT